MNFLFGLIVLELVIGGGGRLFAVGPLSARILMFGLALAVWFGMAVRQPVRTSAERLALQWVVLFFAAHIPSAIGAAMNGIGIGKILGEVQPLLYWLMAPFMAMCLSSLDNVERAARLIYRGGLFVAVVSLLLMLGLYVGVVPQGQFYTVASNTQEVFFRTPFLFFYKGFFYVTLAAIFAVALKPRWWPLAALAMFGAITASLTRGLVLALILTLPVVLVADRRWKVMSVGLAVITLGLVMGSNSFSIDDLVAMGDRLQSVTQRLEDMSYIVRHLDISTLIFGEGLGSYINFRPNIENSYLWALWKLGLLGLTFWLLPLLVCTWFFVQIRFGSAVHSLATAYYGGVLMLYIVTISNPFINNPIGLSYLLIAMFSLRTLAKVGAVDSVSVRPGLVTQPA